VTRFFEDKDAWVVGKYGLEFLNAIFDIESVYDWAVEEFLTTIEEEAKDGEWRHFTVITEDQPPVEIEWGELNH
jgi:hypothetical protein